MQIRFYELVTRNNCIDQHVLKAIDELQPLQLIFYTKG